MSAAANTTVTEPAPAGNPPSRWKDGFWTLSDQAVVSCGNFLSNWLLARNLPSVEYGIFALLFGITLFANSIHGSLITVPLAIHGAAAERSERRRITGSALLLSVALVPPAVAVALAACSFVGRIPLTPMLSAAIALYFFQETVRRALMAELRHRDALLGDSVSYLGQAAAIYALHTTGKLTVAAAFGAIAATSAVAGVIQLAQAGAAVSGWSRLRRQAREFYNSGRWVLLGNVANVLTVQAFPWALAIFRGPAQAAIFQALANVLGFTHPLIFGIGNLVVPASARASARGGIRAAKHAALSYGTQGGALLFPYILLLILVPSQVLRLLYGASSPYADFGWGLRVFAVVYGMVYVTQVLSSLFNAVDRGRLAFMAYLSGGLIAVASGIPLIYVAGIAGALIALTVGYCVRSGVCFYSYWRLSDV